MTNEADLEKRFREIFGLIREYAIPVTIARQPEANPYFAHFLITVQGTQSA